MKYNGKGGYAALNLIKNQKEKQPMKEIRIKVTDEEYELLKKSTQNKNMGRPP